MCTVAPPPLGRCPPRHGRDLGEVKRASVCLVCTTTLRVVHRPVTATGVVVHQTRGGGASVAAPQVEFCLLFFTFLTTFINVLTL